MFKKILCPVDGSDHANKALTLAVDVATKYEARLLLVHVLLRNVNTHELKRFAEIEGLTKSVAGEIDRLLAVDSRVEIVRLRDLETISAGILVDIGEHILGLAKFQAEKAGVRDVSVAVLDGATYSYFRYQMHRANENAGEVHAEAADDFEQIFGRRYNPVGCQGRI